MTNATWGELDETIMDKYFKGHQLASNILTQVQHFGDHIGLPKNKVFLQVLDDHQNLAKQWYFKMGFKPIPYPSMPSDLNVKDFPTKKE
eukprot:1883256-Ditylum_brightwellii.AAC.1